MPPLAGSTFESRRVSWYRSPMTKIGPPAASANIRAIGAIFACKTRENLYIGDLGRAGPVCRRAFVRFKEIMAVRTSFLLDILRDLSERSGGQQQNFFAHHGLPAVSGSPSCPRLQVPDPGLIPTACTDGEDRFGAESPATGSNLENPVRRTPAPGGRISAVLSCPRLSSAGSGRRVATGGFRM
jgi:hypothetical protein